jgi:hypothetical protein
MSLSLGLPGSRSTRFSLGALECTQLLEVLWALSSTELERSGQKPPAAGSIPAACTGRAPHARAHFG